MKFIVVCIFIALSSSAYAQTQSIAQCSNPVGKGYYPELGVVDKKNSGWKDDKITGGITKLVKIGENKYDVLFVDTRQQIVSASEDGGTVSILNRGQNVVSILIVYPGITVEVYTFLKNTSGRLEYVHTLSRAGDNAVIAKASVMRGECDYIDFQKI